MISIENLTANDAVSARSFPFSRTRSISFTAEIRHHRRAVRHGRFASIDNYAIDGTYCYSENLFGSDVWRTVSLYFKTGPEQDSVNAALRLGGYGTTATGQAEYKNISLKECESTSADVVNLLTENGTISGSGGSAEQTAIRKPKPQTASSSSRLRSRRFLRWLTSGSTSVTPRYDGRTLNRTERPEIRAKR